MWFFYCFLGYQSDGGLQEPLGLSGYVDQKEPAKRQESVGPAEAPICIPLESNGASAYVDGASVEPGKVTEIDANKLKVRK